MQTKDRAAPTRRRRRTTEKRPAPERKSRLAAAAANQRKRPARQVVKAPKAEIPEVVYTMPKPFRKGKFLLRLVSVVAVVIALVMAVSIFFKVETITVLGAQKYTAWAVREASGIQEGDPLLTLSEARAAGKIRAALPYVGDVKIDVKLPGTVSIEIRELDVTYAIEAEEGWWLMAADGTLIQQIDATAAAGYTRVLGVKIQSPKEGRTVIPADDEVIPEATETTAETEESSETKATLPEDVTLPDDSVPTPARRLEAALTILQGLEENGVIGEVESVDVTDVNDLMIQYSQRFRVKLGNDTALEYKLRYMASAVAQIEDYQTGVLDVSFAYSEQGIFTPES